MTTPAHAGTTSPPRKAEATWGCPLARAEAHFRSGIAMLNRGGERDTDATKHFEISRRHSPRLAGHIDAAWSDAYVQRGQRAVRDGKTAEADALFEQAKKKSPDRAPAIDEARAKALRDHSDNVRRRAAEDAAVEAR